MEEKPEYLGEKPEDLVARFYVERWEQICIKKPEEKEKPTFLKILMIFAWIIIGLCALMTMNRILLLQGKGLPVQKNQTDIELIQ
jgi:hypothetical protein